MANEGKATFSLTIQKGNYYDTRSASYAFDVSGTHASNGVQNIGTSQELVAISTDVATLGKAFFRNLDATNYVELGLVVSATFYPFIKLKAGEAFEGRLAMANNALYAKANTATVDLEFRVNEA